MARICSNSECQATETGRCLEGFDPLSKCPHYGEVEDDVQKENTEIFTKKIPDELVSLSTGEPLDNDGATNILRQYGARVIACAGHSNVGKTTLFASIYDVLNHGSIKNYEFGGSQTLFAFERLCHYARISSQGVKPNTPHTKRLNRAEFYHLALKINASERVDLLIADRAGEEYDDATNNSLDCAKLYEISRADTLLVLVDADELSDKTKRHSARNKAQSLLKALKFSDMISENCQIGIIMTRFDLTLQKEAEEMAKTEHKKIIDFLENLLKQTQVITPLIVAARPDDSTILKSGFGLGALIEFIIKPIPKTALPLSQHNNSCDRSFHCMRMIK